MPRKFEDFEASSIVKPVPLIVGITGASFSGKTFSALSLATGMQKVAGGDIYLVDTESDRSLHYKDRFSFRQVPFGAPYSPADYEAAIDYCLGKGAKVIIVDQMSNEHAGEGGVLDMVEDFLDKRAGSDYDKRDKLKWAAQIEPKAQRRKLNRKIVQSKAMFILLYRATDKTKPGAGGKPVHIGWSPETTSTLPYEMTARFLLTPGSEGRPVFSPETNEEKAAVKMPIQFKDWFKPGLQLNSDIGEKLARWAMGSDATAKPDTADLLERIQSELKTRPDKQQKLETMRQAFGVNSWKEVEGLPLDGLERGLASLKRISRETASMLTPEQIEDMKSLCARFGVSFHALEEFYGGPLSELTGVTEAEVVAEIEKRRSGGPNA
jgi:hypothetical protein